MSNALALTDSYADRHARAAGYLALLAAYLYQFNDRDSARKALDAMGRGIAA